MRRLTKRWKGGRRQRGANCVMETVCKRGVKLQRTAGLSIFEYSKSRRLKSGCPGTVMGRQQASGISPSTTAASDPPCPSHYQRINPHISGCRNGSGKCQPFNLDTLSPFSLFYIKLHHSAVLIDKMSSTNKDV